MEVDNITERLGCMLCVRQFPDHVNELIRKIKIVTDTCCQIKNSTILRRVLEIALKIGNQLNRLEDDDNKRKNGGIRAFSLRSLVKLSETKSFDKKTTVLHVIAKYAMKAKKDSSSSSGDMNTEQEVKQNTAGAIKAAIGKVKETQESSLLETGDMLKQIPQLEEATKLPINALEVDNKNLRRSLQLVLKQLKQAPIMDPVWGPIRQFAASAQLQMEAVSRMLKNCNVKYDELVEFFAEENDLTNDDFFKMLSTFNKSFIQATNDNKRYDEIEKRKLRLEKEQKEKNEKKMARRKSIKSMASSDGVDNGNESTTVDPLVKKKKKLSPQRNEFGRKITPREALLLAISKKEGNKKE
jgi:hypothetical protein